MGVNRAIPAMLLLACLPFQLAAQSRPTDGLQEAESLLEKQQYDLAENKLKLLVTSQSDNPQAWFDLGFAENHLSKTPDAVVAYKKAVDLSPKWFEANLNLGLALAKSSNFAQAATVLKEAQTMAVECELEREASIAQTLMAKARCVDDPS